MKEPAVRAVPRGRGGRGRQRVRRGSSQRSRARSERRTRLTAVLCVAGRRAELETSATVS